MKFSLREYTGIVPANGQLDFSVHGDKLLAVNIPDSGFSVSFDNGEEVFVKSGIQYGSSGWILNTIRNIFPKLASLINGYTYEKISIFNHTSNAEKIRFLAGFGDVDDKSTQIVGSVATEENQLEPYYYGGISNNDCSVVNGQYVVAVSSDVNRKYLIVQNVGTSDVIVRGGAIDGFYNPRFYGYFNDSSLLSRKSSEQAGLTLPPNASIGLSSGEAFIFSSASKIELNYQSYK